PGTMFVQQFGNSHATSLQQLMMTTEMARGLLGSLMRAAFQLTVSPYWTAFRSFDRIMSETPEGMRLGKSLT
ncbi:MAG: hypothetical protein JXN61_04140, partial [Sedimentisphaerales bacterium]|nr:hypothetical protein [Sedimentisphaerales bacterium]